jgi:hypothetical protein
MTISLDQQYFYRDEYRNEKCRVRHKGINSRGEDWFHVEVKSINIDEPWVWFLIGTAEWLGLTQQEIEWSKS